MAQGEGLQRMRAVLGEKAQPIGWALLGGF
jgi:hypothetical protein